MTLLRSLLIALIALAGARAVLPLLHRHRAAWVWLLIPYLTPALLVGYGYANFALSLVHHPAANAALYTVILAGKLTPVAAFVLHFTPPPLSPAALHVQRLTGQPRAAFLLRAGQFRAPLAAGALVFLFAFGEFEIASLLGIKTWTVKLFDAQAGGLPLTDTLRFLAGPLLVQLLVLALLLFGRPAVRPSQPPPAGRRWPGWLWLGAAGALVTLVPAAIVLRGTLAGLGVLAENFALGREIGASLLLAGLATALALTLARWLPALAPLGLLGPLVVALAAVTLLQGTAVWRLRDTPLPAAGALALTLLPYAVVLRRLLALAGPGTALHVAQALPATPRRELTWQLRTRPRFGVVFLLFAWAYWDLTVGAILAPIQLTPVTARLYNLMHYGQPAVLSALVGAAFVAPLAGLAAALATRRWWARA